MGGDKRFSDIDREIATLAECQHGVVARRQLLELGIGTRAIEHRLAGGRMHALHRGVYAVGHRALRREAHWMAATLATPNAVLSHRSAAALWGIWAYDGVAEVTVPGWRIRRRDLRVRESSVPGDERTTRDGIPVTTVARTLLDLGAVLDRWRLELAIARAEALRLGDDVALAELVARHRGRRGVASVRAVLATRGTWERITRSELEVRFYALIAEAGLPSPALNLPVHTPRGCFEADVAWPDVRLVVELDGRAFHDSARAFEADRARDRALSAAGWRVIRVTWRQLHDEPAALLADLRTLLARSQR